MQSETIEEQILSEIRRMSLEQQYRVLTFSKAIIRPAVKGVPGASLLRFAGAIPTEQVKQMEEAIERDCERIDQNGW
jgi:hypothetical protein